MQIQIDPSVPTNIPPGQLDDFKGFLDTVLESIIGGSGGALLSAGEDLWTGLAAIMVVWTGVKIAMSGNFQPWEVIRLIIGLWVPWAMLEFYDNPLPPPADAYTFPSMIVRGGNWLMEFFMADVGNAMRTELSNMVNTHLTGISEAWDAYNIWDLWATGAGAIVSLLTTTLMMIFVMCCLVLLYCVTFAQVLWAQVAIAILIFLGPLFIPWLIFEPMSFLFWGWFRALIVFSLYGALAGAVMRVFMGVGLGYVTSYSNAIVNFDVVSMGGWVLAVLPLFVAGILASLKVGELASMLVTGSAVTSSGASGMASMAATGGSGGGASKLAG